VHKSMGAGWCEPSENRTGGCPGGGVAVCERLNVVVGYFVSARATKITKGKVMDERKGECQGDKDKCSVKDKCPLYGLLGREGRDGKRRVRGCGDPRARGKRNRAKGDSKARRARRKLGLTGHLTRHEENWGGAFRVEIKAGAQVGPIATRFRDAKAQSDAAKAIGDIRPFLMVAMADGTSRGIVLVDLDEFSELVALITET